MMFITVTVIVERGKCQSSICLKGHMSFSVNKSSLVQPIKDFYFPISEQQVIDGTIADLEHPDTKVVDFCRKLVDDVEWLFRYTNDEKTWSHVNNLTISNPFPGFLSVDTVANDGIAEFFYERAERYFKQNYIRTEELDWFYLDFVVAVSYRVLSKKLNENELKTAYPSVSKAIDEFDGDNIWALVKYALIGLIKNTLIFGVIFFLFLGASDGETWAGFIGVGLLFWKFYGWYSQMKLFGKLRKITVEKLSQFNSLYQLFADGYVRWDMLEHDIKRLRDLSINFPLVLDTAVTSRKKLM